jgi:hypothetical protein
MTACAGGRGNQFVGRTVAVDHRAALGGSYGVEGGQEGAIGIEVPTVAAAATRRMTLLTKPRRLE